MSTLRRIHLLGGPDAASITLMDADTGQLIEGVVKVELLMVLGDGALVNVTQACRLMGINLTAVDAGVPLIDLPEDQPGGHPPSFAEVLDANTANIAEFYKVPLAQPAAPLLSELSEPTKQVLMDLAHLAGTDERSGLPQAARRAPPPEVLPEVPLVVEPDLSDDDKAELAQLLSKAGTQAPGEALQRQQIARAPWPFGPTPTIGSGKKAC